MKAILSDDIKTGKEHKRNAGGSYITQAYYNHPVDPALDRACTAQLLTKYTAVKKPADKYRYEHAAEREEYVARNVIKQSEERLSEYRHIAQRAE